jgi:hypothetical protein
MSDLLFTDENVEVADWGPWRNSHLDKWNKIGQGQITTLRVCPARL